MGGQERQSERHQVLWDGDCTFCGRSMSWFERHDFRGRLDLVPYQSVSSPPMTPELARACAYAVHVQTIDGEMLRAGRAVLFLFEQVGYPRMARMLSHRPMLWAVEVGYWLIARNRYLASRLFFRKEAERDPRSHSA